MKRRGLIFAVLTITALGASQLVATGATTSAGGFRYLERDFSVPGKSQSRAQTARCPRGTHVYGGGPLNLFDTATLNAGYPVDSGDPGRAPDDGWEIFYDNYETFPIDVTMRAVCGKASPRYRTRSFVVPSNKFVTAVVACPRGTFVWGGGASNRGPFDTIYVSQTAPQGSRKWKVTLSSVAGRKYSAKAFAVCGPRRPAYVSRPKTVGGGRQQASLEPVCPSQRHHVVSAGFSAANPTSFDIQGLHPDHRDDGDGVPDDMATISVTNYASSRVRAVGHAVCLR